MVKGCLQSLPDPREPQERVDKGGCTAVGREAGPLPLPPLHRGGGLLPSIRSSQALQETAYLGPKTFFTKGLK